MTKIKIKHAISHLKAAQCYANNSFAVRKKVGAIIVKGDIPIALGWNGRLPGQPNICEDTQPDGSLVTRPDVRHAEINALNKLWRSNESANGAILFCTTAPCISCAPDLVQAGISGVVYEDLYRSPDGITYLLNAGVTVYQFDNRSDKFYRIFDSTEGNIITFMLPSYKTELEF